MNYHAPSWEEIQGGRHPEPPQMPNPWTASRWVIGPLLLALAAAICAWRSLPTWIAVLLIALAVVAALLHLWKARNRYWLDKHLYSLKMMSRETALSRLSATPLGNPDFDQLDPHYPGAAAKVHHRSWELRNHTVWVKKGSEVVAVTPSDTSPDLVTITPEDQKLFHNSGAMFQAIVADPVLRGSCYVCRGHLRLAKVLRAVP